ncbi:hypothetical protein [Deinococcus sp. UYEF24]
MIDELVAYAIIERLWNIKWEFNGVRLHSHAALMREYLRRSALLIRAVGASDDSPWTDPAGFIQHPNLDVLPGYVFLSSAPEYPGVGFDPLEDRILALNRHLSKVSLSPSMKEICFWAIRWATVQRQPAVQRLGLPDLFEPLLVLYKRGGYFRTELGQVDFGGLMIMVESVQRRIRYPPLMSFEPDALDALDIL